MNKYVCAWIDGGRDIWPIGWDCLPACVCVSQFASSGELMMSLFWYYRPEHTQGGRDPSTHCEVRL